MSFFDRFFGGFMDAVQADAGALDSSSAVAMPGLAAGSAVGVADTSGREPSWTSAWGTAAEHQPAAEAWTGSDVGHSFDGGADFGGSFGGAGGFD